MGRNNPSEPISRTRSTLVEYLSLSCNVAFTTRRIILTSARPEQWWVCLATSDRYCYLKNKLQALRDGEITIEINPRGRSKACEQELLPHPHLITFSNSRSVTWSSHLTLLPYKIHSSGKTSEHVSKRMKRLNADASNSGDRKNTNSWEPRVHSTRSQLLIRGRQLLASKANVYSTVYSSKFLTDQQNRSPARLLASILATFHESFPFPPSPPFFRFRLFD